jgi:hypothetical protein
VWAYALVLLIAIPAYAQDITGDLNSQNIDSTVNSNNPVTNYNGSGSSPGSIPDNPVMSAIAPTMMGGGGNDSCLVPSSTGVQVTLFGISRGTMEQDPECNRRKDARLLGTPQPSGGLGLQVSGISVLCADNPRVFRAMALANTPCPIMDMASGRLLIGQDAFMRYRSNPELFVVGYELDPAFWDALLLIGQELPDVEEETGPRLTLSERFRTSIRPGPDRRGAGDTGSGDINPGD